MNFERGVPEKTWGMGVGREKWAGVRGINPGDRRSRPLCPPLLIPKFTPVSSKGQFTRHNICGVPVCKPVSLWEYALTMKLVSIICKVSLCVYSICLVFCLFVVVFCCFLYLLLIGSLTVRRTIYNNRVYHNVSSFFQNEKSGSMAFLHWHVLVSISYILIGNHHLSNQRLICLTMCLTNKKHCCKPLVPSSESIGIT